MVSQRKRKKRQSTKLKPLTAQDKYNTLLKKMQRQRKKPDSPDQQTYLVMKHLMKHGSISQAEAISEYDIYRLSARIYDLRGMDVNIITEDEPNKTRRGTHARYRLEVDA